MADAPVMETPAEGPAVSIPIPAENVRPQWAGRRAAPVFARAAEVVQEAEQTQVAGYPKRLGAFLIDVVVHALFLVPLWFLLNAVLDPWPALMVFDIVFVVFHILYFSLTEGLAETSPGKMLLRMKVVAADGGRLGFGRSLGRNALRIVDGMVGYLVGSIIIWSTRMNQRLGDIAAKALVVQRLR